MVFVVSAFPKVCGSGVMEAVNAGFRCVGIGLFAGIKMCLVTTLMLGTLTDSYQPRAGLDSLDCRRKFKSTLCMEYFPCLATMQFLLLSNAENTLNKSHCYWIKKDVSGILSPWQGIDGIQQVYSYVHRIVSLTHKTTIVFPKIPVDSAVSLKC